MSRDDDHWATYPLHYRERAGTCVVNLSFAVDDSRQEGLPVCVLVRAPMNADPDDEAAWTDERGALDEASDAAIEKFEKLAGAELAGHVREPGVLTMCFYARTEPGEKARAAVVRAMAGWRVEIDSRPDPEWTHYREELAPSDLEWEWSQNVVVEMSLAEAGDPLIEPRPVEHWAFLPTRAACDQFAGVLREEGFEVKSIGPRQRGAEDDALPEGSPMFEVACSRRDVPTADELSPITSKLRLAADDLGGEYDGWETSVLSVGE